MSKPFHQHDCEACEYLASLTIRENNSKWQDLDFYYCVQNDTVVSRYGAEAAYYSTPFHLIGYFLDAEYVGLMFYYLRVFYNRNEIPYRLYWRMYQNIYKHSHTPSMIEGFIILGRLLYETFKDTHFEFIKGETCDF